MVNKCVHFVASNSLVLFMFYASTESFPDCFG